MNRRLVVLSVMIFCMSVSLVACGKENHLENNTEISQQQSNLTKEKQVLNKNQVDVNEQKQHDKNNDVDAEENEMIDVNNNTYDEINIMYQEDNKSTYELPEMKNITLQDAIDNGCEIVGFSKMDQTLSVQLKVNGDRQELVTLIKSLEGMAIAELKEAYSPSFNYLHKEDECVLTATLEDFEIAFQVEHGKEAIEEYQRIMDESELNKNNDLTWSDMECVQSDKITNVEIRSLNVDAIINIDSTVKLNDVGELTDEILIERANELTITNAGYNLVNTEK